MSEQKKTVGKTVAKKTAQPKKKEDVIFNEEVPTVEVTEKKPIIEEKEQKAPTISVEEHMAMMKRMEDLEARLNSSEARVTVNRESDSVVSLADDFMDEAAIFFSYSSKFSVWGDKRRGEVQTTPNGGGIKFEAYYRYNNKVAGKRGTETVSISRAVIRSKREAEWLRQHSQFGIKFFENIQSAIDQDVFLAEKMVQVSNMVSGLGDMQVIARAKKELINISDPDISNIRQQLIKKIATKDIAAARTVVESKAKQLGLVEEKTISERSEAGDTAANVY